jgi:chromosome segregation ATPase
MHQLESLQRERGELQRHLASAQERLEQSTATLETLNATLEQREQQVQETGHALQIMQVRLETEVDLRQRLEQEATEMRALLKEIMTQRDNNQQQTVNE